MFTQPVSSPPPGPPAAASSTVSPRPSRLRGLSYLRNYTHSHLLSRDASSASVGGGGSSGSGASSPRQSSANLTRSASYTPTTTTATTTTTVIANRLTLTASSPDSGGLVTSPTNLLPTGSSSITSPINESSEIASSSAVSQSGEISGVSDPTTTANPNDTTTMATLTATTTATAEGNGASSETTPSIRFSSYYDPRSTRPSLSFSPITRTLPNGNEVIRVGRYSERDTQTMANPHGNQPSAAPVGFKSKVVSRRHCEFWSEDGKWFIKDVKSSSGTFLNHIRLSPPSQESKAFPVNDGDIVQLGIDFKGGEEMIFRCVKMRLELNRGWQTKLNSFNVAAHKRLRTMAAMSSSTSQDCSICLNSIAPCQSLFVAPCSHTWHFKCIRALLTSPQYPIFICPNCRAGADLEADVDELSEEWQLMEAKEEAIAQAETPEPPVAPTNDIPVEATTAHIVVEDMDAGDVTMAIVTETPTKQPEAPHTVSQPLPISNPASGSGRGIRGRGTPSPPGQGAEGPITPRNDAGPWVFDGTAGRRATDATEEMRSIDAAAIDADMTVNENSDGYESIA